MSRGPWSSWLRALLALMGGAALILVMVYLGQLRAEMAAPLVTVALAPMDSATAVGMKPLPRAWDQASRTPFPTPLPTKTPAATPESGTPLATEPLPTETPEPLPSPTHTPVHYPADDEPTHISIPVIQVDVDVVPVELRDEYRDGVLQKVWQVADYAAGYHRGSALPGRAGNTVIAGHNNTRGEVFRDLYKLKPGDDIYVWVDRNRYHYRVHVLYRLPAQGAPTDVQEENLRWILPTDDQRLTLVTCWPYWTNTHRIVVIAFPAP